MSEEAGMKVMPLVDIVNVFVERHIKTKGQEPITNLHALLLKQVEPALFETVMKHCRYNQHRASQLLGISRGNFRTKLIKYFGDKFCGSRDKKEG